MISMETETKEINEKLIKLARDVSIIKNLLLEEKSEMGETELTDWAKEELKKAREAPEEEYVSHEELKKQILAK